MADLNIPLKGGRRRVQAPRVDLTPMVDLGFLLITFFMFTTTLSQHKSLELKMPTIENSVVPTVIPDESTITLIPGKGHQLYYYNGALASEEQLRVATMSKATDIVLDKKSAVAALPADMSAEAHKLHVLIKPMDDSKYEDMVQLLDVMLIADVPYYVVMDVTEDEKSLVRSR